MRKRILHVLSQRPSFTGSGVSLNEVVRCGTQTGWDQQVIVGTPPDDPQPAVGGLSADRIHPLAFGVGELDFPLPGMSDVMPYPSSRFSELTQYQLETYREAWKFHLLRVLARFRPDVIHSRHVWLVSALLKDVAPDMPVVTQCHATGLRQMALCPHLADEVKRGCARNERFLVIHRGHAETLAQELGVDPRRIHIVRSGFRADVFHARGRRKRPGPALVYAGKYSHAKGLPYLLDAVELLAKRERGLILHVAGAGAGAEAEALRKRMAGLSPLVVMHGQLDPQPLAELMRRCSAFVLPSFYEGLPLVLIEALACGCRLVSTDLPSLRHGLGPEFDPVLDCVPMPRLIGPDVPAPEDCPAFVERLVNAIEAALAKPPLDDSAASVSGLLEPFTWEAVFARIERIWLDLIAGTSGCT
jgi:glycosyltransferase involved in cell wall biosynthesis